MTTQATVIRRLVIGVGNDFRGDDAAGLALVRRLRGSLPNGTVTREVAGDAAGIIDAWQGFDEVVIVDACSSGEEAGALFRFDAVGGAVPEQILRECSTHAVGIANVIELARTLGRLPPTLTVFAIEGTVFSAGAPISHDVSVAVDSLAAQLRQEWSRAQRKRT